MLSYSRGLLLVAGATVVLLPILAGCSAANGAPAISNVWPSTIVRGQTQTLIIQGQGFKDGATVTFGAAPGDPKALVAPAAVWVNERYVSAGVPPGIAGPGSQYSVLVTNPDGQSAVSPQAIVIGGAPATAVATPAPTKAALPTPTPTRIVATPSPSAPPPTEPPAPTATATPSLPVVYPPLQPPPTPTPVDQPPVVVAPTQAVAAPSVETPTPAPPPPTPPPTVQSLPVQPVRPERRSPR